MTPVIKPATLGPVISLQVLGCRATLRTVPATFVAATVAASATTAAATTTAAAAGAAKMLLISSA